MASSDAWTRESCVATWLRSDLAVAQVLGPDVPDGPLRLRDQVVELLVAPDVQRAEPLEELRRGSSTAESRKTFGVPSSLVPLIRSVRW